MSRAVITILGCGNSSGVPAIGNYWGACDPQEPKNERSRSSILIKSDQTTLIVDTGPDFRHQLNRENIGNIDAVLYSHHHSDHTAGIDELRALKFRNKKECIAIYVNKKTCHELQHRFHYLFHGGDHALYPPILKANEIMPDAYGKKMQIGDIIITPFEQDHGTCQSVGYRFGDTAYSVDILTLDDKALETLKGIKTWIVDCAGYHDADNPVHAHLNTIYKLNETIKAETVYLTSLSFIMDYQTLIDELPDGYDPCYDGLKINVTL